VAETFFNEFQSRFLWGKYAVTTSGCVGPCNSGPNVLVYPEGVLYTNVQPTDVAEIIDEHLLGGQPVERLRAPVDVW
jgi:(2Fe-2S) ferredoxin